MKNYSGLFIKYRESLKQKITISKLVGFIFAVLGLLIAYFQLLTSQHQETIIKHQAKIMEQQTKIMKQQNEISIQEYENSKLFNDIQIKLLKEQTDKLNLQTDISIEPRIDATLFFDSINHKYKIKITNSGGVDIIELKVIKRYGLYNANDLDKSWFPDESDYWYKKDVIKKGDYFSLSIPDSNLTYTWKIYLNIPKRLQMNQSIAQPAVTIKFQSLRKGDRKPYYYTKIFFFDKTEKSFRLYDPEKEENRMKAKVLSSYLEYEKQHNWNLPEIYKVTLE